MSQRTSVAALALAALGLGVSLSGCSVAGTDFHPGVAARVGDTTVRTSQVDRLATGACDVLEPQLAQANQVVPMRLLKSAVMQALALEAAARQFGADYGVTPSAQYTREVDANTNGAGDIPAEQVEALVLLRTSSTLVSDVLGQVGAQLAADAAESAGTGSASGDVDDATPGPDSDEAQNAGSDAFALWLDDHEIEVDPQYDVQLGRGGPQSVDTSISFAVGESAKANAAEEPDQAATLALPASQRCGGPDGAVSGLSSDSSTDTGSGGSS